MSQDSLKFQVFKLVGLLFGVMLIVHQLEYFSELSRVELDEFEYSRIGIKGATYRGVALTYLITPRPDSRGIVIYIWEDGSTVTWLAKSEYRWQMMTVSVDEEGYFVSPMGTRFGHIQFEPGRMDVFLDLPIYGLFHGDPSFTYRGIPKEFEELSGTEWKRLHLEPLSGQLPK